jgi:alkylhydroperoxidase/carboxymuconolactone decarboxylase family protein YurZ
MNEHHRPGTRSGGSRSTDRYDGADERTKEPRLVASLVLRCDDCVTYHLERSVQLGVSRAECLDVFNVGLIVGGSIVIPHLRRALRTLDALLAERHSGR